MKKWYESSVFYHLYPLGAAGAPAVNDKGCEASRFGELDQWIPYLRNMGFDALYIGPLFESGSHGYDTRDYRLVDRRLGSNEDFRNFVDGCHKAGIRVIVDAVFNHTGREFFAFRDIRERRWDSPFCGWYRGVSFHCSGPLGDPFCYEAWQGHFSLPCLNLQNPEVRRYIFDTVRFWVETFHIDGLRLDCANVLDFHFMEELRSFCDSLKEDFWLMGEVIHGDYDRWVNDRMLHSVTNYALHKALYSAHNDHNYFEIAHNVRRLSRNGAGLYTFADNHDEDRLASKLADREHFRPLYTLLFTLPGIPSVYYGSEWGMEGKRSSTSDAALRPSVSPREAAAQANGLTDLIRRLIRIHRENPEFHSGLYQELLLQNRRYAFARYGEDSICITAVSNDSQPCSLSLPLPISGKRARNLLTGEELSVNDNILQIDLDSCGAAVIKVWDALMEEGAPLDQEELEPGQLKELLGEDWEE